MCPYIHFIDTQNVRDGVPTILLKEHGVQKFFDVQDGVRNFSHFCSNNPPPGTQEAEEGGVVGFQRQALGSQK